MKKIGAEDNKEGGSLEDEGGDDGESKRIAAINKNNDMTEGGGSDGGEDKDEAQRLKAAVSNCQLEKILPHIQQHLVRQFLLNLLPIMK